MMPRARQDRQNGRGGTDDEELEGILGRIAEGDRAARERLFDRYRCRLVDIVRARLGKRSPRDAGEASDIVQKALAVATRRLDEYVARRPMPVFPWLYTLTRDQIGKASRNHRTTFSLLLADDSALALANDLVDSGTTPGRAAARNEMCRVIQQAVDKLKPEHREILTMRYHEGLKLTEIAAVLGISDSAARMRHLRAIEEMKGLVGEWGSENGK